MNLGWAKSRTNLLYGAFFAVAFLLALRWTFPSEAVKERLIYEAGAQGWQIDMQDVGASGVLGVSMEGVSLTDANGVKLAFDELGASLRVLPLLIGKRTLDFHAALYGGTVQGRTDLSGGTRRFSLDVAGVNLAPILLLRKATGLDLVGVVNATADLRYPGAAPAKASGTVELTIEKGGIAGGRIPISGFQDGFPMFAVSLGTVRAAGSAREGVIDLTRFQAAGGDLEIEGEGMKVMLQPRLGYSPIGGRTRVRIQPSLWQKPTAANNRPVFEAMMMAARTPNGAYQYQLFGSLALPRFAAAPNATGAPPPPQPPPGGPPPGQNPMR